MKMAAILRSHLLVALLIVLGLGLWTLRPMLLDPYMQTDDFRNLYEVHRYIDPTLFPRSESANVTLEEASTAYYHLLAGLSRIVSPLIAGKLLGLFLLIVGGYYAYRLGTVLVDSSTGVITAVGYAVFSLTAESEISAIFGLQRSFVTPLFLALIYYLHQGRYVLAAVVVLIAGLIYPPCLPVAAMAYGLNNTRWKRHALRPTINRRAWVYLLFVLALVVVAQAPLVLKQLQSVAAETAADSAPSVHILRDATYAAGGRRALFVFFPLLGRGGLVTHAPAALQLGLLAAFAAIIAVVQGKRARPLPRTCKDLFWASVLAFLLSWLAILLLSSFLLYIPSRHTQSSLLVILVLYVTINARGALATLATRIDNSRRYLPLLAAPLLLGFAALAYFLPQLQSAWYEVTPWMPFARWLLIGLTILLALLLLLSFRANAGQVAPVKKPGNGRPSRLIAAAVLLPFALFYVEVLRPFVHVPTPDQRALYQFVESLPSDALFAGDPCTLDDIPFYARRSVVFNCELYNDDELILASLRAYYAADAASLAAYCSNYQVAYLIINARTLTADTVTRQNYFFTPYTTQLVPELAGRSDFYLRQLAADSMLFQQGDYAVVTCPPEPDKVATP